VKATGNYAIDDPNGGIGATLFPLPCHFQLVDTNNASDTFDAGTFLLVSTQGAAVTRSYSVTDASSGSGIAVSTSSSNTAPENTGGSNQNTDTQGRSNGLSGGLVAATVICSLIGASVLIGFTWWILRRRNNRRGTSLKEMKTPSPSRSGLHEVDSRRYGPELSGSGAPTLQWLARRELPASTWASGEYQSHSPVAHEMAAHRERASSGGR